MTTTLLTPNDLEKKLPSAFETPVQEHPCFQPSKLLGETISRLHDEQQAIDREAAEKLAMLRALQDRD